MYKNNRLDVKRFLAIWESHKFHLESDENYVPSLRPKIIVRIHIVIQVKFIT